MNTVMMEDQFRLTCYCKRIRESSTNEMVGKVHMSEFCEGQDSFESFRGWGKHTSTHWPNTLATNPAKKTTAKNFMPVVCGNGDGH